MQIFEPILKLCYVTKFQDQDRFDSKIAGFQYLGKFEKSLSVMRLEKISPAISSKTLLGQN